MRTPARFSCTRLEISENMAWMRLEAVVDGAAEADHRQAHGRRGQNGVERQAPIDASA